MTPYILYNHGNYRFIFNQTRENIHTFPPRDLDRASERERERAKLISSTRPPTLLYHIAQQRRTLTFATYASRVHVRFLIDKRRPRDDDDEGDKGEREREIKVRRLAAKSKSFLARAVAAAARRRRRASAR